LRSNPHDRRTSPWHHAIVKTLICEHLIAPCHRRFERASRAAVLAIITARVRDLCARPAAYSRAYGVQMTLPKAVQAVAVVVFLLAAPPAAKAGGHVWQFSTIAALMAGAYDGSLTVGELRRHGNLGVGTFNGLNGEMIVLDRQVWQVPASGRPALATDTVRVPFAAVTRFEPHSKIAIPAGLDIAALAALLDKRIGDHGLIQAVRIDGGFVQLKVRSVRAQIPPYQPLAEVLARDQVVFDLVNVRGTLVGFRFPACFSGVNAPGWHFHFLAADRRSGGHVLDLVTGPSRAMLDVVTKFAVEFLPIGRNKSVCTTPQSCVQSASP
jgi:acetolactate decarboxylase